MCTSHKPCSEGLTEWLFMYARWVSEPAMWVATVCPPLSHCTAVVWIWHPHISLYLYTAHSPRIWPLPPDSRDDISMNRLYPNIAGFRQTRHMSILGSSPCWCLNPVLPEPCRTHVHPLWKPILTQLRGWWISTATDSSMARDKQLIVLPEVDNHTFFPLAYVSSHTFLSTTGVSETKMGWFHLFFSKTFMWTRGRKNWTHVLSPNYNCFYKGKKFQPRLPPEVTIEANFPGNLYMD